MKKLIKEFPNAKYYNEGNKNILNQSVLNRYYIDYEGNEIHDGYIIQRSKKEIKQLQKIYGPEVIINEFIECYLEIQ